MNTLKNSVKILVAEDDPDDQMMIREALEEVNLANRFCIVNNGLELLQELRAMKEDEDNTSATLGCIVLLDLNMPKMDGREALQKIKADPALKRVPIVVLTTSQAEEDIVKSYDLGVSGFISKPVEFDGLLRVVKSLKNYWLEIVELP